MGNSDPSHWFEKGNWGPFLYEIDIFTDMQMCFGVNVSTKRL